MYVCLGTLKCFPWCTFALDWESLVYAFRIVIACNATIGLVIICLFLFICRHTVATVFCFLFTGLHSNGFSLVRKILAGSRFKYTDSCPFDASQTIGKFTCYLLPVHSSSAFSARYSGEGLLALIRALWFNHFNRLWKPISLIFEF